MLMMDACGAAAKQFACMQLSTKSSNNADSLFWEFFQKYCSYLEYLRELLP